jgi:hypothetical protein
MSTILNIFETTENAICMFRKKTLFTSAGAVNLFGEIICIRFDNNQEHKSTVWENAAILNCTKYGIYCCYMALSA